MGGRPGREGERPREPPLSSKHIMQVAEGMFDQLREAEPRERTRWRHYPRSGVQSLNGYTFDFGPREYDSELRFKRQWFNDRLTFIDTNLLSRPIFEPDVPAARLFQVVEASVADGLKQPRAKTLRVAALPEIQIGAHERVLHHVGRDIVIQHD